jgi:hypothetical protein
MKKKEKNKTTNEKISLSKNKRLEKDSLITAPLWDESLVLQLLPETLGSAPKEQPAKEDKEDEAEGEEHEKVARGGVEYNVLELHERLWRLGDVAVGVGKHSLPRLELLPAVGRERLRV